MRVTIDISESDADYLLAFAYLERAEANRPAAPTTSWVDFVPQDTQDRVFSEVSATVLAQRNRGGREF